MQCHAQRAADAVAGGESDQQTFGAVLDGVGHGGGSDDSGEVRQTRLRAAARAASAALRRVSQERARAGLLRAHLVSLPAVGLKRGREVENRGRSP